MRRPRNWGTHPLACLLMLGFLIPTTGPLLAQSSGQIRTNVPYEIHRRPQPQGTDLGILLPLQVGPFTRAPLPAAARLRSDEDLNTTYTAEGDTIFVGFSRAETLDDARSAVTTTRDEAIASKLDVRGAIYRVGMDPSFFKTAKFMAWTRGRYFYYVDANRASALERFMRAFPY